MNFFEELFLAFNSREVKKQFHLKAPCNDLLKAKEFYTSFRGQNNWWEKSPEVLTVLIFPEKFDDFWNKNQNSDRNQLLKAGYILKEYKKINKIVLLFRDLDLMKEDPSCFKIKELLNKKINEDLVLELFFKKEIEKAKSSYLSKDLTYLQFFAYLSSEKEIKDHQNH